MVLNVRRVPVRLSEWLCVASVHPATLGANHDSDDGSSINMKVLAILSYYDTFQKICDALTQASENTNIYKREIKIM